MKIEIRNILFVFFMMLISIDLSAQTIILKQTVPEQLEDDDDGFGPNRRHFDHPYGGIGFSIGEVTHQNEQIAKSKPIASFSVYSGTRFYRNFGNILSSVCDFQLSYDQYNLNFSKDTSMQMPIANIDAKKVKYWFLKSGISWGLQFNLMPKRGNQMGTYIFLGGYGNWLMFKRFSGKYKNDVSNYAKISKIQLGKLQYMESWEYGPLMRIGRSNFSIFAKYRLSNYFKRKENVWSFYELPRLTIGIQLFAGNI